MAYYVYKAAVWHFYGNSIESIECTINHVAETEAGKKFGLPKMPNPIIDAEEVDKINIHFVWPIACNDHYFDVKLSSE